MNWELGLGILTPIFLLGLWVRFELILIRRDIQAVSEHRPLPRRTSKPPSLLPDKPTMDPYAFIDELDISAEEKARQRTLWAAFEKE